MIVKKSPERLLIDINKANDANEKKHLSRYRFAMVNTEHSKLCCDIACGSGYGSYLLSNKCDRVVGVDNSKDAIDYATKSYNKDNLEFFVSDIEIFNAMDIGEIENKFGGLPDAIVSLETIEHVPFDVCKEFLMKSAKILKKTNGVFVGSSPMLRYKDGNPYVTNPWHINEMPKQQLVSLIEYCFSGFEIKYFHQKENLFAPLNDSDTSGFLVFVATL